MTIDESTVVVSAPAAEPASQQEPSTSEARWAAWEAKGAAHDRAVRRKMIIAAPILMIVVAVLVYALVGR
jgi:hypothetical protein